MNIKELTDQLAEKFGSHRKVAELLLIHEVGYCGIRKGRRRPSKRLVQAMKNLLDAPGAMDAENREINRKPIPKETWNKLK